MLINMAKILADAKSKGYGIVGPCPKGIDQIKWCFEIADQMRAPMIICNHASVQPPAYMSLEEVADVVKYYALKYPHVPAALNLDHGDSFEMAVRAMKAGFTGVMVDKSMYPLEENIRVLKETVKMAHMADVGVEAALGGTTWRDPTPEEIEANLTRVDEYRQLVQETKVDAVAVFVGGSHADFKSGETLLHYDLITQLRDATPAALVMHGTSQTGDDKISEATKAGMTKYNVSGDLLAGGLDGYDAFKEGNSEKYAECMKSIEKGFKKRLVDYMNITYSANRY